MQPELALTYNSRASNGIVGVGWTLTGFSQITRCAATVETAASAQAVKFDDKDTFCLDGDPIVGDKTKLLSPLHDPYTRIRVESSDSFGPTSFIVELKNGRIVRYGGGSATIEGKRALQTADGTDDQSYPSGRYAWLVADVSDRRGNQINYSYIDFNLDYADGCAAGGARPCYAYEKRPSSITYTNSASGTGGTRRIDFTYDEQRPDLDLSFVSGFALKRSGRLSGIAIFGPTTATGTQNTTLVNLRRYDLAYETAPVSGRSRLTSVTECDGGGVCRKPTTFEYENGAATFHDAVETIGLVDDVGAPSANGQFLVADFDGDGADDLVYQRGNNWYFRRYVGGVLERFSPEKLLSLPAATDDPLWPAPPVIPADVDHNGTVDLIYPQYKKFTPVPGFDVYRQLVYRVFHWTGSTFEPLAGHDQPPAPDGSTAKKDDIHPRYHLDFDGDGRLNLVTYDTDANAWFADSTLWSRHDAPATYSPLAAPVDGSRAWSVFLAKDGRYHAERPLPPLESFMTPFTTDKRLGLGDTNGDGMADAVIPNPSTAFFLATGTGFRKVPSPHPEAATWDVPNLMPLRLDFFQDGHAVWLMPHASGLTKPMMRPRPLAATEWLGPPTVDGFPVSLIGIGSPLARTADVNADGLEDLILPVPVPFSTRRAMALFIREGKRADMLTRIHAGMGDTTAVSYAPAWAGVSATGIPSDRDECKYPLECGVRGIWVAKEVVLHAGTAFERKVAHTFIRGASDRTTGNFLGFFAHVQEDTRTGSVSTTTFERRNDQFVESGGRIHFPYGDRPTRIESVVPLSISRRIRTTTTISYGDEGNSARPALVALRPADSQSFRAAPRTIHIVAVEEDTPASGGPIDGPMVDFPIKVKTPKIPRPSTTPSIVLRDETTSYRFDGFGNVTLEDVETGDLSTTTTIDWRTDATRWLISMPRRRTHESFGVHIHRFMPRAACRRWPRSPRQGRPRACRSDPT